MSISFTISGNVVAQLVGHCATIQKIAGSVPHVIGNFSSGRTMAKVSIQPPT